MQKRMTIAMDEVVYEGYSDMAQNVVREEDALNWSEAFVGDVNHAAR